MSDYGRGLDFSEEVLSLRDSSSVAWKSFWAVCLDLSLVQAIGVKEKNGEWRVDMMPVVEIQKETMVGYRNISLTKIHRKKYNNTNFLSQCECIYIAGYSYPVLSRSLGYVHM